MMLQQSELPASMPGPQTPGDWYGPLLVVAVLHVAESLTGLHPGLHILMLVK